jgi:hypothetical protein
MGIELSPKDRQFADLHFGGPDTIRGSARACYRHLHPRCKDSTAETEGPAVLRKPQVKEYLEQQSKKVTERADVNAQWVLEESVRLFKMVMGDIPAVQEKMIKKKTENDNTIYEIERYELCNTNLTAAIRALELIDKHTSVQAFSQKVEIHHTHHLEKILNVRCNAVERAAAERKPPVIGE